MHCSNEANLTQLMSIDVGHQCTSTMSYKAKNFNLNGGIKYLVFNTGMLVTENDLFPVSSIRINTQKGELSCFIDCIDEDKDYVKEELKNKLSSVIYIGPRISDSSVEKYINPTKRHVLMGFNNIYEMHFITSPSGMMVVFKHDTGRRYKYADNMEYVFESHRKL